MDSVTAIFPSADRMGTMDGDPPIAPVYADRDLLGHVFLTDRLAPIPAYSGSPISTMVGINLQGSIQGLRIVHHEEPILVVGIKPEDLQRFVDQYRGMDLSQKVRIGGTSNEAYRSVDGISGATITVMVINASMQRSLPTVAEALPSRSAADSAPSQSDEISAVPVTVAQPESGEDAQDAASAVPDWASSWARQRSMVVVLVVALVILTAVLLFHDHLARHAMALRWVRGAYLTFTIVFLGWFGQAQLSVVDVLTFVQAIISEFRWEAFLLEPLIFILWCYVAVALLLWGRGVFCGWLCPYGALQVFTHWLGRRLGLPQLEFPQQVHERLRALKVLIFIVLFALSLQSMQSTRPFVEVEPFSTVFSYHFARPWPYVTFALVVLVVSTVNRKFFCKYLCPLGAALAIPAPFRLMSWLHRRKECGSTCHICRDECEVRAIQATGVIDVHECHYCLECQVSYWSPYKCPPLVARRERHERYARRGAGHTAKPAGAAKGPSSAARSG